MDFAAPERLFMLAAAAALAAGMVWRALRAREMLARIGDPSLVEGLIDPFAGRWRPKAALGLSALALLILAASRPQFGSKLTDIHRRGNDVFIALDVSKSMLAEDAAPSRLEAAKRALGMLIQQLKGDRVGIVTFAGGAYLACPLTLDVDAARLFLESVRAGDAPKPGTSLGEAVRASLGRFPERSKVKRMLVLLTDGEDTLESDPLGAARAAAKAGVRIYTVGLGSSQGEVIRERDENGALVGFKKDDEGKTVLSRLDEATLAEMARISGGRYLRAGADESAIAGLAGEISSSGRELLGTKTQRVREERYQLPLLAAILLMLTEVFIPRRRGHYRRVAGRLSGLLRRGSGARVLFAGLLIPCCLILPAEEARADFRSEIAKGNKHYRKGEFAQARQAYLNAQAESPESPQAPYNAGNTYYYEGDFAQAVKSYEQAAALTRTASGKAGILLKSACAYNRGCALFRDGRQEEAVEAFKEALRLNPHDEDAKYNIEWIGSPKRPREDKGEGEREKGSRKLSKEDAERILEMIRDQERKLREALRRQEGGGEEKAPGGKDW